MSDLYGRTDYRSGAGDHLHLRRVGGPWWYWRIVTASQEVLTGGPCRGKAAAISAASRTLGRATLDCEWTPDEVAE